MKIKAHLVFDKTKKSIKIKSFIEKKIESISLTKSKLIVVVGGDGFMLQTLKKYYKLKKLFYGVNSGHYGFLMNKFYEKNFLKNLSNSKLTQIHPLQMFVRTKNNQLKKSIAINEVSILRQSKQTASLKIYSGKSTIIKKLISDGVLVSTPAGSTAYNLSVRGPILNLDSKKLAITPISPFRPRRWRGTIISERSNINIKNLNVNKRPISAVADNFEVRNVRKINIKINKKINFNLLFNNNNSLHKKIKIEQLRKETNTK